MKSNIYINLMLLLLALVIVFHVCIIVKLIPYHIAWGGRLTSDREMYLFEVISIVVNLLLFFIVAVKGGYIKMRIHTKVVNTILWVFFFLFILNTIGNLFAKTNFEKAFAILTLLSAFFIWKIIKGGVKGIGY